MAHEGAVGAGAGDPEVTPRVDTNTGDGQGGGHRGDLARLLLAVSAGIDPDLIRAHATRGDGDLAVVAVDPDVVDRSLAGGDHDEPPLGAGAADDRLRAASAGGFAEAAQVPVIADVFLFLAWLGP